MLLRRCVPGGGPHIRTMQTVLLAGVGLVAYAPVLPGYPQVVYAPPPGGYDAKPCAPGEGAADSGGPVALRGSGGGSDGSLDSLLDRSKGHSGGGGGGFLDGLDKFTLSVLSIASYSFCSIAMVLANKVRSAWVCAWVCGGWWRSSSGAVAAK